MIQKLPTKVNSSEFVCILESNAILKAPCLNLSHGGSAFNIHNFDPFKYCNPKIKILHKEIYFNKDIYTYDVIDTFPENTDFKYLHPPIEIKYSNNLMQEITQCYTLNIEDYIEWEWNSIKLPLYIGDFSDIEALKGRKLFTIAPVRNSLNQRYLEFSTVDGLRLYISVVEMHINEWITEEEERD